MYNWNDFLKCLQLKLYENILTEKILKYLQLLRCLFKFKKRNQNDNFQRFKVWLEGEYVKLHFNLAFSKKPLRTPFFSLLSFFEWSPACLEYLAKFYNSLYNSVLFISLFSKQWNNSTGILIFISLYIYMKLLGYYSLRYYGYSDLIVLVSKIDISSAVSFFFLNY